MGQEVDEKGGRPEVDESFWFAVSLHGTSSFLIWQPQRKKAKRARFQIGNGRASWGRWTGAVRCLAVFDLFGESSSRERLPLRSNIQVLCSRPRSYVSTPYWLQYCTCPGECSTLQGVIYPWMIRHDMADHPSSCSS